MSTGFWTDAEVRRALGLPGEAPGLDFRAVTTDTRALEAGDLFVALRGERFDAHDFLEEAVERGARGAVVSRQPERAPAGLTLYGVPDTLVALGALAAHWRYRIPARFVGVVGSNGKTTTKELIRAVLAPRYRVHATQGNLNNQVGVPLTLLGIPAEAEAVVVEMGTNRPGEISALTHIVRPDAVVVTSIGEEHLELLGDLEGVLREELSVLEGLAPEGTAFVAEEPAALPERAREAVGSERVRVAGLGDAADLRPDGGDQGIEVLEDGSTLWRWRGARMHLPLPGRFNVRNALLALGVGVELGVDPQAAAAGLGAVSPPRLRGEWHRYGELRVLADCYNSNPPSLAAAVDLLASLPPRSQRIAVLGTMREMGEATAALHAASAEVVLARLGQGIDRIVATGEFVPAFAEHADELGDRLVSARDPLEAYEAARIGLRGSETILLKASRGDQLERWLPLLERDFGSASDASSP